MKRPSGWLYFTGAFILAGTSVVAARFVGSRLGMFTVTAMSLLFALPALVAMSAGKIINTIRKMTWRDWVMALLQAVFGIVLFRLLLLMGLSRTSAAEAGILTGATPAATALLAGLLLRERISPGRAAGILFTVAGVLLLQGLLTPGMVFSTEHIVGNLLVLLAALSESVFNILSRAGFLRATGRQAAAPDPISQTALVTMAALLLCLIPAAGERPITALVALDWTGWLALLWYGLFATAAAYICWYSGIFRCEASVAAAFSGLMPLTALALSAALLGERPGWQQLVGGALVVAGMLLVGVRGANKNHPL